jgi:hypothetical protein
MTKKEQLSFIRVLTRRLRSGLIAKVVAGGLPPEWDGYELRQLIVDHTAFEAIVNTPLKGRRLRDYKNECIKRNL